MKSDLHTGDSITVGDISGSVTAIGRGAQATIQNIQTYIERELSQVEIAQQAQFLERQRLAEALTGYIQRLQRQEGSAVDDEASGNALGISHSGNRGKPSNLSWNTISRMPHCSMADR